MQKKEKGKRKRETGKQWLILLLLLLLLLSSLVLQIGRFDTHTTQVDLASRY